MVTARSPSPDRSAGSCRSPINRDRPGLAEQQRVAIRLGSLHRFRADDRAGAGAVLDDDGWPIVSLTRLATMRATESAPPPAA